jgi:hypothetical protein
MRRLVLVLCLMFAAGPCHQALAGGARDQSALVEAGENLLETLAAEDYCAARARFDANLTASLTTEILQERWFAMVAQFGSFKTVTGAETLKTPEDRRLVFIRFEFEKTSGTAQIVFDSADRVAAFLVAPNAPPGTLPAQQAVTQIGGPPLFESGAEAKRVLGMLEAGQFPEVWELFTPQLRSQVGVERLRGIWESLIRDFGVYKRVVDSQYARTNGNEVWNMRCSFQRGFVLINMAFDGQRKISGIYFTPTP